ncbi:MAG TPA: hypothetical protein VFO70_01255 [Chitinophagaceae bacterium]|nr:hypothetical protein [Chitinophagaceae bacterium]
MQLVKSITPKRINALYLKPTALSSILVVFVFLSFSLNLRAQDNSPYTRYGIGDIVPSTNINSRGMGGISAGHLDFLSINFNNPASYSSFQALKEAKSNKLVSGRAILDLGLNFESRTLREPANPVKFVANNALFSHIQVGMPLRKNWGLSFGLRPISRVSYKIGKLERLIDPNTGQPIDSAYTEYGGDGGSYLASLGTGFTIFSKMKEGLETQALSIGINGGYFFGKKDYSTRRSLLNDSVEYYRGNFETRTTYGNLYFNAGLQYRIMLNEKKRQSLTLGAYGNWGQTLNGKQDIIRETYFADPSAGNLQLDSVSIQNDIKGKIEYPSSYTFGFVYEKQAQLKESGWLLGIDFTQSNWDDYLFYGQKDFVANKWELKVGTQIRPAPTKNYFSNIAYRAGFFTGPDYIRIDKKIQQFGLTFGLGLPLANYRSSFASPNQATLINLAFEYIKRGNDDNLLKENLFRFSLGFSLSDLWFIKRKYD